MFKRPTAMKEYTTHTDYTDINTRMPDSYSISKRAWKGMKKLYFHSLDLTVNPYKSCGGRTTNLKFMEHLVRDLIVLL
jgi:hypothetical protein